MSKYWSELVKRIEPYVPGEQPKDKKYIKLNTNENPYPPSPKVIESIKRAADESLRLYPDPDCNGLRETIAEYHKLKKEQVFVGNGSDEVLAFAYMAFFNPGKPILFPDITYTFYPVYSDLFNIDYKTVELDEDFSIPEDKFFQDNGGIIISNPKSPTAQCMDISSIKNILNRNTDRVVIIDEAYIDFGGQSAVSMIDEYPNLLVVQTLSKSRSLAGLRIGFALGHRDLIEALDRIKNSFNSYTLDRIALIAATEAFRDEEYFRKTVSKIVNTRERVSKELNSIGFRVTDSKANFIFISHPEIHAGVIFKELRDKGILVRHFKKPRIDNFLRVSIGTDEDMNKVVEALKEIIK
ncbi:MAG: histidinol-phosphate transaminase [Clostridia bacterium]|nr:histidinol-phosphate transaminase [Clostridia bacterium]